MARTRFALRLRLTYRHVLPLLLLTAAIVAAEQPSAVRTDPGYGRLPLSFEVNEGQSDGQVRYQARGAGYGLFLTGQAEQTDAEDLAAVLTLPGEAGTRGDVFRLELERAARGVPVRGEKTLPGKVNYLLGNDPAKWHADVPTYAQVRYAGVYPGVDLVFYGTSGEKAESAKLEYDFVVAPGADARLIRLHVDGAQKLELGKDGALRIVGRHGKIAFRKPEMYQVWDGKRRQVGGGFRLLAGNRVEFVVGGYDRARELVIDPVLEYSTYLGGSGSDAAAGIAVDAAGEAYVVGTSTSTDYPTTSGAYQRAPKAPGTGTVVVTKLDATGTRLLYSTYLGGSGGDTGTAIAIDTSGNAYVVGSTYSSDFPVTSGAFQTVNKAVANGSTSPFVAKLNSAGSGLAYSTYLGGSWIVYNEYSPSVPDSAYGVAVDASGNAYVTGQTSSFDFPVTAGAFQTSQNASYYSSNAFISKVNATGTGLVYSTYLGGSDGVGIFGGPILGDLGSGIAVDTSGSAYVAGTAATDNFPVTQGAYDTVNNQYAVYQTIGFVTKLNPSGSSLEYSTYLGGYGGTNYVAPFVFGDASRAIAIDGQGNAYVTGTTYAIDFPTTAGAFQTTNYLAQASDASSAFVTKLNASGSALGYSTFLSGTNANGDSGAGIAVDSQGRAFVTGSDFSTDFPVTPGAFESGKQESYPVFGLIESSAYLTELNASGTGLEYSTYLGGTGYGDGATGVALDAAGSAYIAGGSGSKDFPVTQGAYQQVDRATANSFVAKFAVNSAQQETVTTIAPSVNPQQYQRLVVLTAQVTPLQAGGTVSGSVRFDVNGVLRTRSLNGQGQATLSMGLGGFSGNYTASAMYLGNGAFGPSLGQTTGTIVGPVAGVSLVSGTATVTTYGVPFATPFSVRAVDQYGNPVAGALVYFASKGVRLSSTKAVTDANGVASIQLFPEQAGDIDVVLGLTPRVTAPIAVVTVKVNKSVLTVTAKNESVAYGQPVPAPTYTITGFVQGDTASVVTGAPVETTTATSSSAEGVYPIKITQGTLTATNYSFKMVNGTVTVTTAGPAAKPAFLPVGGTYAAGQMVVLSDATAGSAIHYTLDGSEPTAASPTYTSPIVVTEAETIRAIAVAANYEDSAVASQQYWVKE